MALDLACMGHDANAQSLDDFEVYFRVGLFSRIKKGIIFLHKYQIVSLFGSYQILSMNLKYMFANDDQRKPRKM